METLMSNKRSWGARLVCGWMRLHGLLPLGLHRFQARILAFLTERVFRYRREVVTENLLHSFPNKTDAELAAIRHHFYRHFADVFTEAIWYGGRRGKKGRERLHRSHLVEFTNPEEFNRLMALSGQVMIMSAHTGNWELVFGIPAFSYGEPLNLKVPLFEVTYRRLSNAVSDQVVAYHRVAALEDLGFAGYVESDSVKTYVHAHREPGRTFLMITDQYPYGGRRGMEVEFMHRKTYTMSAAAKLAVRYDMATAYLRCECREEGGYRMTLVPLSEHAGGEDPAALMQRYYRLLEQDLEAQPWNYLWTHRRWK